MGKLRRWSAEFCGRWLMGISSRSRHTPPVSRDRQISILPVLYYIMLYYNLLYYITSTRGTTSAVPHLGGISLPRVPVFFTMPPFFMAVPNFLGGGCVARRRGISSTSESTKGKGDACLPVERPIADGGIAGALSKRGRHTDPFRRKRPISISPVL